MPLTTSHDAALPHTAGETSIQSTSDSDEQEAVSASEQNSTLDADTGDHSALNNSNQSPQSTSDTHSVTSPTKPAGTAYCSIIMCFIVLLVFTTFIMRYFKVNEKQSLFYKADIL